LINDQSASLRNVHDIRHAHAKVFHIKDLTAVLWQTFETYDRLRDVCGESYHDAPGSTFAQCPSHQLVGYITTLKSLYCWVDTN